VLLGEQLDRLLADRGWQVDVAVGSVLGRWPQIVGPEIAEHVEPVAFENGVLTVRAASTAWATQMRLLTSVLLGRLEQEVGAGTVTEVVVAGPSAPSWSKGRRRAQGRGPRDTYG
jgi:predicted nucleic acid-binding Zn ribbon protein